MELASIKSYQRTIASVDHPMRHFIQTGFWDPTVVEGWTDSDIGDTFVRRACRAVARELKRPFIQCYAYFSTTERVPSGQKNEHGSPLYKTVKLPVPKFEYGYVEMPKQKRLMPLASPLLLMPDRHDMLGKGITPDAFTVHINTLWRARILNQDLWNQYYEYALNDPECRAGRGLTH